MFDDISDDEQFEYHTFLHHSQTNHTPKRLLPLFEYHTFLHHSQTTQKRSVPMVGLNTIHFYIILKPQI